MTTVQPLVRPASPLARFAAWRRMQRAHRLAAGERLAEAAGAYREAAAACPTDPRCHAHLARTCAALGDSAAALAAADEAMRLTPQSPAVHLLAGIACFDVGDMSRARAALERAAALSPANDLVRAYLDLVAWREGETRAATHSLTRGAMPESSDFLARLLLLTETELRRIEERERTVSGVPMQTDHVLTPMLWRPPEHSGFLPSSLE